MKTAREWRQVLVNAGEKRLLDPCVPSRPINQCHRCVEEAFAACQRDALESAAKVILDEMRLRPMYWGVNGGTRGPLARLVDEIRALIADGGKDVE